MGEPVPDGTVVTFTTDWGSLEGADPMTPQTPDRPTANGVATARFVAEAAAPPTGAFQVSAECQGNTATVGMQAEGGSPPGPTGAQTKLVVQRTGRILR